MFAEPHDDHDVEATEAKQNALLLLLFFVPVVARLLEDGLLPSEVGAGSAPAQQALADGGIVSNGIRFAG